jgi:hypothetical protein
VLDPESKSGPIDYQIYKEFINFKYRNTQSDFLNFYAISDKSFAYYFCNEEREPCFKRFTQDGLNAMPLQSLRTYSNSYGGPGSNEFEKQRKRKEFNTNIYPDLLTWRNNFWENDSVVGYLVKSIAVGEPGGYDFDKGGFWMSNIISQSAGIEFGFNTTEMRYASVYEFENKMEPGWVLLKIDESEAEQLVSRKVRTLYAVIKVRMAFNSVDEHNPGARYSKFIVVYNFNYESPVVEFYEDAALVKKVGELSYEKAEIVKTVYPPNF